MLHFFQGLLLILNFLSQLEAVSAFSTLSLVDESVRKDAAFLS
jgi:hypothetical protein